MDIMLNSSAKPFQTSISTSLQQWRKHKKISQLELAFESGISQRHISYLETGKSAPSRSTVVGLALALKLPLRESNMLLQSAGFAANYAETELNDPSMMLVKNALEKILSHHNPFPALVVDRLWNIKMVNQSTIDLFSSLLQIDFAKALESKDINLAELTLSENGFKPYIKNLKTAVPILLQRFKHQAITIGTSEAIQNFNYYQELVQDFVNLNENTNGVEKSSLLPVIPLELQKDDISISLFSVISTFGTPQDITTDELRIESFYPADKDTKRFFETIDK